MQFTIIKGAVKIGSDVFAAGIHEAEIVKDWFVDALIKDGVMIIHKVEEVAEEIAEEVKPKRGKKQVEEVSETQPAE